MDKKSMDKMGDIVQGIPVYGVFPGDPADQAGLRAGDYIIECNGVRTPTVYEYLGAVKLDQDNVRTVKAWRNGVELDLSWKIRKRDEEPNEEAIAKWMIAHGLDKFLLSSQDDDNSKN